MALPSTARRAPAVLPPATTVAGPVRGRPRLLRSWAILLIGALISGSAGLYFAHRPGVYWSQVQVLFIAPKSVANPNGLSVTSESLVTTAGVVAKMVGSSPAGPPVVSDTVTLVGEGIRHGYGVRLPNTGGQFATNFDQAALDVQAAGTTVAELSSTLNRVLAQVFADLSTLQSDAGVAKVNLIRAELSPPTPPIYYQAGSKTRALAVSLLLGGAITWTLVAADRRRAAARSRRQRHAPRVS